MTKLNLQLTEKRKKLRENICRIRLMLLQRDSGRNPLHILVDQCQRTRDICDKYLRFLYVIQFLFREMNNPYGLAQNSSSASISLYFCDFAIYISGFRNSVKQSFRASLLTKIWEKTNDPYYNHITHKIGLLAIWFLLVKLQIIFQVNVTE